MIKKLLYTFLFLSYGLTIQAQQSNIRKGAISFEFVNKEVKGTISGFESKSRIDWNQLENSYFEGSVAVETLDTNNGLRNWSLKSGKYFDKNDYPRIHFKSSEINQNGIDYVVKGVLTLKGIKKPLVIEFKRDGDTLVGSAELYSYDFDIKIKKKREDNLVKITFRFEQ
ncbi:YceI family protein [Croceitalea rosinachiae]|uniref:YceI family protein n=1 Tax=Croceitalea rosinachiae TaxID=3075596 RepID=A0ABU3ABR6_9FLAO|nr:YceI family protein [Croceitalea sp. F388]MDT0607626.1 YceI family protein [Croceitalea sp. F388]